MRLNFFLRFFGIFLFAFFYIPLNIDEPSFQIGNSVEVDAVFLMDDNASPVGDIAADGRIRSRLAASGKTHRKVGRTADADSQCGVFLRIFLRCFERSFCRFSFFRCFFGRPRRFFYRLNRQIEPLSFFFFFGVEEVFVQLEPCTDFLPRPRRMGVFVLIVRRVRIRRGDNLYHLCVFERAGERDNGAIGLRGHELFPYR